MPKKGDIESALKSRAEVSDMYFVQIGSFDGETNDPLRNLIKQFNWSGVFVEPMADYMNKLKELYKNSVGFQFECSAIGDSNEQKEFYYLNSGSNLPKWFNQISTLDRDYLMQYREQIPNIEKHIFSKKVNCITFDALLDRYEIKKIDLLHIDAEGQDFKIIQMLDFDKIKPKLILFEHKSIYLNWIFRYFKSFTEYLRCLKLLKKEGYIFLRQNGDTLALLTR